MKIACLILASGLSKRYGLTDKLTQDYNDKSLILNVIQSLNFSSQHSIYAVIAKGNPALTQICTAHNITPIYNPDPERGQGQSLKLAVQMLSKKDYEGILIALGDMPNISAAYFDALSAQARAQACVFSENRGVLMPPCIIPKSYFPRLLTLSGDRGARSVLTAEDIAYALPLSDAQALDIDTPSDGKKT